MHRIDLKDDEFNRIAARQLRDEQVKAQIISEIKLKRKMSVITTVAIIFLILQIIFTVIYL